MATLAAGSVEVGRVEEVAKRRVEAGGGRLRLDTAGVGAVRAGVNLGEKRLGVHDVGEPGAHVGEARGRAGVVSLAILVSGKTILQEVRDAEARRQLVEQVLVLQHVRRHLVVS